MKLKYLTVALLFSIYLPLQSQEFGFGVKGGLNTISIGDIITVGSNGANGPVAGLVFEPQKDLGFQFGGYFFAQFGKLYVRPELNYFSSKSYYDFPNRQAEWSTSKIDFPILVGYDLIGPISVYAGPGFSFFGDTTIEGVQETGFTTGDAGPDIKTTAISFNIGIAFRYKRLGIDLRYELEQTEVAEEREDFIRSTFGVNLADLQSYNPNILSLSVSYDIFRTDAQNIGSLFSGLFKNNKCYCPYKK